MPVTCSSLPDDALEEERPLPKLVVISPKMCEFNRQHRNLLRRAWVRVVFVRQRYMSEARDASSMAVLVRASDGLHIDLRNGWDRLDNSLTPRCSQPGVGASCELKSVARIGGV